MLTRKHFTQAAGNIRKMKTHVGRRKATADFIRMMRQTGSVNPRFNRGKFKKAAGSERKK